jgi:5-hydroxyisourate hydrolase-like protein (transthyretin family)
MKDTRFRRNRAEISTWLQLLHRLKQEDKMSRKIFKVFVMIVLFFTIFTFDVDARITSRIRGRVVDEKTGESLEGVTVDLFYFLEERSFATKSTTTDAKGAFVFDNLKKHKYFLQFMKIGYIDTPNEYDIIFARGNLKRVKMIDLNEGEIRFFHIRLKRGASVQGTVYLKDISGVSPLQQEDPGESPRVEVALYRKVKAEETDIFSKWVEYDETLLAKDGTYYLNGLEPKNTYELVFQYDGFFSHVEMLDVLDTESFEIDHTFDNTDNTGISVKVFVNNEPRHAQITLRDMADSEYLGFFLLETNDRYVIKNAKAGHYNLSVFVFLLETEPTIDKLIPVVIEAGKTKFIDLKY